MAQVTLRKVVKYYDEVEAVSAIDLDIVVTLDDVAQHHFGHFKSLPELSCRSRASRNLYSVPMRLKR